MGTLQIPDQERTEVVQEKQQDHKQKREVPARGRGWPSVSTLGRLPSI